MAEEGEGSDVQVDGDVDVQVVAYGRPAGVALATEVQRAKGADALAPVTVVVPSNIAGLTARRLLGGGVPAADDTAPPARPGIANVSFVTPFRLAELLTADLLLDRRPLTNPVLGAAVRTALADDPGPFREAAHHPATEAALAELYAELSNVSPSTLDRLEGEAGPTARAGVRLHRAVRGNLAGFHDEADLARTAATRPDLGQVVGALGHVVWYLPQPLTAPMAELLGAVLRAAPATVILGLSGVAQADAPVHATCERAGVRVGVLAGDGVPTDPPTASRIDPPAASRIVSVTDADEEVRAVVRDIAALAEQGVPLDRIGVFHPTPDPYLPLLGRHLEAADIPANGPSPLRLADAVAGRVLLGALALPARRWRRDLVLDVIGSGPLRHGDAVARPNAWERASREAGVVGDLDDWRRKLGHRRDGLARWIDERRADAEHDPDLARSIERRERDLGDVEQLADFVDSLAAGVTRVESASGWRAKSGAARALLEQLLGPGHRHQTWPEVEQAAYDRVEDALVRLATLAELEDGPSHDVFVRALATELDVAPRRSGRFGEGVLFGPLAGAVGHDLDAVFVLGCTEGRCPAPRRDDALLPDDVRVAARGELHLRAARLHDQHRAFLAALAAAPAGARTLTFPRGDLRDGGESMPSRWLLESAGELAGETVHATDFADLGAPTVHVVPSHAAAVVDAPVAASVDERDLSEAARYAAAGGRVAEHPAAMDARRGLVAMAARRSSEFTEWDGNLVDQPIPSTAETPLSPSRLETWAACGYRYFLGHVLGLRDREDPERVIDLDPRDRGGSVHRVLERFFGEAIDDGAPDPSRPWSASDHERLRVLADEELDELAAGGRTGRAVLWHMARAGVVDLVDHFLEADDEFRAEKGARPEQVELAFGLDGAPPVEIALPDGRVLRFRGRADRVDRDGHGRLLVSDYKTGRGEQYRRIETEDPVQGGTMLQLGLYAEAAVQLLGADDAEAAYWIVDHRVPFDRHGYPWTADRRTRFVEVLSAIVDGIEGGVFPAVPGEWDGWRGTHRNCTYCAFDGLCSRDRGEQADAKVDAPELAIRRTLEAEEPA